MESLRIYIVEDMAISRASLEDKILAKGHSLVGSVAKAEKAWKEIQEKEVDLVLLDINLAGEKDGIWLAQQIREHLHLPFIYLTAYGDANTLKAVVDTKPNGYLMKPYKEATLLTTITIALENFNKAQNPEQKTKSSKDFIYIKDSYIKVKVAIQDINYIQSDGNYLHLVLPQKKHLIRAKLDDFHKELPEQLFVKVHRRYIVNSSRIDLLGNDYLVIKGEEIPMAKKYKKRLQEVIHIYGSDK